MGNIIDYVREYGKYTFTEEPLNEVDSLVLCQIVYLNFAGFVPGLQEEKAPVSIQSIFASPQKDRILENYWYREDNKELFAAAAQSVRFGSLKMNYYVNIINEEAETQFSAMTYILEDKNVYLAYRGTDANIVGWKEDFNLAFSKPIHSQYLSAEYMNRVAGAVAGGFYAGGHSKGGNLAVYAAMNCSERARGKLLRVFNNDGPGFRPEILEQGKYAAICDRVKKFIPRSSMVGMILESHGDYEVVESRGVGLLQHNAYSWKVNGTSFIRAKNVGSRKIIMDAAVNEWILSLTQEEIHAFVDTLYDIISATEAKNLFEFGTEWKKCLQSMVEAVRELDESTRGALQKIVRSLFEITGERAAEEIRERKQERRLEIEEKLLERQERKLKLQKRPRKLKEQKIKISKNLKNNENHPEN